MPKLVNSAIRLDKSANNRTHNSPPKMVKPSDRVDHKSPLPKLVKLPSRVDKSPLKLVKLSKLALALVVTSIVKVARPMIKLV